MEAPLDSMANHVVIFSTRKQAIAEGCFWYQVFGWIFPCLPKMKHSKFQNINFQFNNHHKAKSFPIRKKCPIFFVIENLLQMVVEFMYPQTI